MLNAIPIDDDEYCTIRRQNQKPLDQDFINSLTAKRNTNLFKNYYSHSPPKVSTLSPR